MEHGNRPERESGDEDYPPAPLPPHERTWRHPSELGDASLVVQEHAPALGRAVAAGAALAGLVIVVGLTRLMLPGDVDDQIAVMATSATARVSVPLVGPGATGTPATSLPGPAPTPSAAPTVAAPATLVATSAAPVTTAPVTAPPVTATPVSATPVTTTPVTAAPVTSAPVTTAPAAPVDAPPVAQLSGRTSAVAVEIHAGALYVTTRAAVGDATVATLDLDGVTVEATVVLVDEDAGIAVLQVRATTSVDATLTSSDSATPGEEVSVLGDHGGAMVPAVIGDSTTPAGSRELLSDSPVGEGAPVLDEDGNLLGICTASGKRSWLVPAAALAEAIAASTELVGESAWLGLSGEHGEGGGVLVVDVVAGGPAELAGILAGDLITTFDGDPLLSLPDLADELAEQRPGDEVVVTVQRGTERLDATVILGARPA